MVGRRQICHTAITAQGWADIGAPEALAPRVVGPEGPSTAAQPREAVPDPPGVEMRVLGFCFGSRLVPGMGPDQSKDRYILPISAISIE